MMLLILSEKKYFLFNTTLTINILFSWSSNNGKQHLEQWKKMQPHAGLTIRSICIIGLNISIEWKRVTHHLNYFLFVRKSFIWNSMQSIQVRNISSYKYESYNFVLSFRIELICSAQKFYLKPINQISWYRVLCLLGKLECYLP